MVRGYYGGSKMLEKLPFIQSFRENAILEEVTCCVQCVRLVEQVDDSPQEKIRGMETTGY